MKKIGVYFKDNDFWYTYTNVLRVIAEMYQYEGEFPFPSKKELVEFINLIASPMHWAYQSRCEEEAGNHLGVDADCVFVDDELNELLTKMGESGFNSELHVLSIYENGTYSINTY